MALIRNTNKFAPQDNDPHTLTTEREVRTLSSGREIERWYVVDPVTKARVEMAYGEEEAQKWAAQWNKMGCQIWPDSFGGLDVHDTNVFRVGRK